MNGLVEELRTVSNNEKTENIGNLKTQIMSLTIGEKL
jgi:hypothetical protein